MNIIFKWSVGDVVRMPMFGGGLIETEILERRFREDKGGSVIEYETDLLFEGISFTQDEIEKFN